MFFYKNNIEYTLLQLKLSYAIISTMKSLLYEVWDEPIYVE